MRPDHRNIALYIAKCVTGFVLLYSLGQLVPHYDMSWVLISMLLVLSPDSKEAMTLALTRLKANLVASVVTVVVLLTVSPLMVAISVAMILTVLLCVFFNLMTASRPALAAIIIIALHPMGMPLWDTALERVLAVVAGCAVGLLLTFVFHRTLRRTGVLGSEKFGE